MSRLIDLLSLSRVEVDEHIVPDQKVPLLEVVQSVITGFAIRAAHCQMSIQLKDRRLDTLSRPLMYGFRTRSTRSSTT